MAPKPKPHSAIHKIERSKIPPGKIQRELMGDDIDLEALVVYLRSKVQFDLAEQVIDAKVNRTIDGASTLDLTVNDYNWSVTQSRRLNRLLDVQVDGMWFRLVKVSRQPKDDNLDLTFEQREIAVLRSYPKPHTPHDGVIFVDRAKTTRAEFILRLLREVKEFSIPVVIPQLHKPQEIANQKDAQTWNNAGDPADTQTTDMSGVPASYATNGGIPLNYNSIPQDDRNYTPQRQAHHQLFVTYADGGQKLATRAQIRNANAIISTGASMRARRKVIVCAIMTSMIEAHLDNLPYGDGTSIGLFQQIDSWGSFADRHDPVASSRMFYKSARSKDAFAPDYPYGVLCQQVQGSAYPDRYALARTNAERFVNVYGIPGGDWESSSADANAMGDNSWNAGSDYFYHRGTAKEGNSGWKREDSWTCIRRLADEVGWRAFFIGAVFYLITDNDLYKTQPVMMIDQTSAGIEGIGFDIDVGKPTSEVQVQARTGRWLAPPGSIIVVRNCGPANGRWLVSEFNRSLFDTLAEITCIKPQAKLPEPLEDDVKTLPTWAQVTGDKPPEDPVTPSVVSTPKSIIDEIVLPMARARGMVTGIDPKAVAAANAAHGPTVSGNRSDHQGPPNVAWAVDMSNSAGNSRSEADTTPQMQALSYDLAKKFGLPWVGQGETQKTRDGFRYQMLYRTLIGGNHYNHVHFGVRRV